MSFSITLALAQLVHLMKTSAATAINAHTCCKKPLIGACSCRWSHFWRDAGNKRF